MGRDSFHHLVDLTGLFDWAWSELTGLFDWDPSDLTGGIGVREESRLIISYMIQNAAELM